MNILKKIKLKNSWLSRISNREISIGNIFQSKPREGILSVSNKSIAGQAVFFDYNPDDLVQKKGLQIYDQMRYDDQVKNSMTMKKEGRLSLGWRVKEYDDSPESKKYADFLRYVLEVLPGTLEGKLREILTALDYGFSVTEKVYRMEKFGPWKGKWVFQDLKTRDPHDIDFKKDEHGDLLPFGVIQNGKELPTDKFIIYSYNKEFDNWYGTSDLRAAYRSWWSKDIIIKFWNIYLERFGQPPIIGSHSFNSLNQSQRDEIKNVLEDIQTKTGIVTPSWLSISLLETVKGAVSFENAVDKHNLMIARSIVVPDLVGQTSDSGQGSFALGKKHFDVFLWVLNRLGQDIQEMILTEQVIKPLIVSNFGMTNKFPKVVFESITEESNEAKTKILEMGIQNGFIDPNETWIRDYINIPEKERVDQAIEDVRRQKPTSPDQTIQPPQPSTPTQNKKNGKAVVHFRKKLIAEEKVQFQKIENEFEDEESVLFKKSSTVVQKQIDGLISTIRTKKIVEEKNTKSVDKLEVKHVGELKKVFFEGLSLRGEAGAKDARGELAEGGIRFQKEPDLRNLVTPQEVLDFFSSVAFDWAGSTSNQILTITKNEILIGIANGKSTNQVIFGIQQKLEPFLGTDLVDDAALTTQRLETMIRTNLTNAYNQGRKIVLQDPKIVDEVPVLLYSAIIDGRQTEFCERHDGKRFLANDPIWNTITPSNHFNCRSIIVPVVTDELEEGFRPDKAPAIKPSPGFFKKD